MRPLVEPKIEQGKSLHEFNAEICKTAFHTDIEIMCDLMDEVIRLADKGLETGKHAEYNKRIRLLLQSMHKGVIHDMRQRFDNMYSGYHLKNNELNNKQTIINALQRR